MVLLIAAECPQLWKDLRKIRIAEQDPSNNNRTTQEPSPLTPFDLLDHIIAYLKSFHHDNITYNTNNNAEIEYNASNVYVEMYNHASGTFVPLLNDHSNSHDDDDDDTSHAALLENERTLDHARHVFSRRIRCIIHILQVEAFSPHFQRDSQHQKQQPLLIKGRYYEYNPEGMDFAGTTLIVKEEVNRKDENGTGLNVWDGSLLLSYFLEKNRHKVRNKSVLELGSGPGLVGISAAILGCKSVILSDLSYALPLMKRNVELNQHAMECNSVHCVEIDWFSPPDRETICCHPSEQETFPEVILIADCVWLEELVNPLMDTVEKYCNADTEVIIAYQCRGKAADALFWKRVKGCFQNIQDMDTLQSCGLSKPESISLLLCQL